MVVVITVVAIAFATVGLLLATFIGLYRALKSLSATLQTFQEDVQPAMEAIQAQSAQATERMQEIADQRASMAEERPRPARRKGR